MRSSGLIYLGIAVVAAACGGESKETPKTRAEVAQGICDTERAADCSTPTRENCEELVLDEWNEGEEHGCGAEFEELIECVSKARFVCDDSLGTYRAECSSLMNTFEDCAGHGM